MAHQLTLQSSLLFARSAASGMLPLRPDGLMPTMRRWQRTSGVSKEQAFSMLRCSNVPHPIVSPFRPQ